MHTIAFLALFLFCVISTANAHMYLNSVFLNGAETKSPVRKHPANQYDYPLSDKVSQRFSSTPDLICGWPPALDTKSDSKLSVAAGQQVFLQWWHASVGDDVVDGSHKGPCSVYMAKSEDGKGAVWFKVYEEGWNPTTKEWCTDRIRKDNAADGKGRVKVTIPSNLQAGNYLVRSEFWALHEGYTAFGAQPYVGCLEVTVTGSGNVSPNNNLINFEGYYKSSDPGLLYNIYSKSDFSDYNSVIPGGRVNAQLSGGSGTPSTTGSTNPTTTPTTTPGTSPTTTPGTCSTNQCQSGAVGCSCGNDAKKSCDRGLSCHAATNLCLPLECETGSEKCICTQGGACDAGLTCFSNLCVKVTKNTDAAIDADSSSSSLSFSVLSIFLGAAVAALGL